MIIYVERGYTDRSEYLKELSDEHGLIYEDVRFLSELLGDSEDFDSLVAAIKSLPASINLLKEGKVWQIQMNR